MASASGWEWTRSKAPELPLPCGTRRRLALAMKRIVKNTFFKKSIRYNNLKFICVINYNLHIFKAKKSTILHKLISKLSHCEWFNTPLGINKLIMKTKKFHKYEHDYQNWLMDMNRNLFPRIWAYCLSPEQIIYLENRTLLPGH